MYVTIFRNRKCADMDAAAYQADSERMAALAEKMPGFRSIKSFHAEDGEVVTLTEWDSEAHAKAWGRNPDHAAVQARGRGDYYDWYELISVSDPVIKTYRKGE